MLVCLSGLRGRNLAKIRLYVRLKAVGQGYYIASVPMKQLVKLSSDDFRKKCWSFKDGWLILEGF
jgi:hypothetical protein